ncbi:MAG: ABC transporter ATP-binding protein [Synechococcales bacterium]|nr:ABC transporter ATP-binding protein/permease [Cyanobacteria bacterium REEB444]MEB3125423.1 ABC transporter ATP-binding protein [Synechococcales bacterium]
MTVVSSLAVNRPRENDWRLFLRMIPYASRHRHLLLTAMVLLLPLSAAGAIQPILVGEAISLIRQEPNVYPFLQHQPLATGLNILAILLLFTFLIRFTVQAWQGYLVQVVGQQMTADIRNHLFTHLTSLAMGFFDRTPVGRLITRMTNDVEALGEVFSTGAIGIISDLFSMVAIALAMFFLQSQLAVLLIFLLIPTTGLIIYFQHRFRLANFRARDELSALNSMFQENILGIGIVQLFRREQFNQALFRHVNQKYVREVDATIFYDSAVSATLEWIALVAIAVVLWFGGRQVMEEAFSLGTLTAFILFAQRLFDPLRQFAEKFTMLQSGFTAVERIVDLLNEPVEIQDPSHPTPKPVLTATPNQKQGEIRFEQVWFAYKKGEYILQDLNFTIQPGEKIALVGPTGAGKSSVIRLLCRLYEPTHGRILIDGIDIRDIPQSHLRRYLGVILQDGFIFTGDVISNIRLGEQYSLEEIKASAEKTNVASFIDQLPQNYHTPLRQRGTNLSSGQKQLLAFARVAIRQPHVVVLDEATANLDVGTEAVIQSALDGLLKDRTAIIIAHRLSTIRHVDRILLLQQGRLVESGSHDDLVRQGGLYASLHQLQRLIPL